MSERAPEAALEDLAEVLSAYLALAAAADRTPPGEGMAAMRVVHDRLEGVFEDLGRAVDRGLEIGPALDAVLDPFEAEARRRLGGTYIVPLVPYGLMTTIRALREGLAYRTARDPGAACDCPTLVAGGLHRMPSSDRLTLVAEVDDPFERSRDYRCQHCGQAWRWEDVSNEQLSWDRWTALPPPTA